MAGSVGSVSQKPAGSRRTRTAFARPRAAAGAGTAGGSTKAVGRVRRDSTGATAPIVPATRRGCSPGSHRHHEERATAPSGSLTVRWPAGVISTRPSGATTGTPERSATTSAGRRPLGARAASPEAASTRWVAPRARVITPRSVIRSRRTLAESGAEAITTTASGTGRRAPIAALSSLGWAVAEAITKCGPTSRSTDGPGSAVRAGAGTGRDAAGPGAAGVSPAGSARCAPRRSPKRRRGSAGGAGSPERAPVREWLIVQDYGPRRAPGSPGARRPRTGGLRSPPRPGPAPDRASDRSAPGRSGAW